MIAKRLLPLALILGILGCEDGGGAQSLFYSG